MYFNLSSKQQDWDNELIEEFADYTIAQLHSSWLKLIQTNIIYGYCESLIVEDTEVAEKEIALILKFERGRDWICLLDCLPFGILAKLKQMKRELKNCHYDRQWVVNSILNLIIENTLLHNTLSRFTVEAIEEEMVDGW